MLAPHAKLRAAIVPAPAENASGQLADHAHAQPSPARLSWARLLKRVFDIDIEHCPNCAGRLKIIAAIEAVPADTGFVGTFTTSTPESVLRHKRALYAISIDEPLIPPAGAAIDVPLTFKRCHQGVAPGCPVTPELEQWGYDPATHLLHHTASGKCVNISGARVDAGSPIILYPCSGAANEKWTIVERAGSPIWSIKSELTAMCLHALTGRVERRDLAMAKATTLVQMPCDGSDAQRFTDIDANWPQRNRPR